MPDYMDLPGLAVAHTELNIPKAKDLALALERGIPYARLVECRRLNKETEVVVMEVDVEVPQVLAHPIEPIERLAVEFHSDDRRLPAVLTLRRDFPLVPHLYLGDVECPRSLCLYTDSYRDLKRTWTAPRLVNRIREWLALTAKGILHQEDQPLEPLLLDFRATILLPRAVLNADPEKDKPPIVFVTEKQAYLGRPSLIASEKQSDNQQYGFVVSIHHCKPQQHGLFSHTPRNLQQVADFAQRGGLDLLPELRDRLRAWDKTPKIYDAKLVIVMALPKTRTPGGPIETREVRAFLCNCTIRELGENLGAWAFDGKAVGALLVPTKPTGADRIEVSTLNPVWQPSREGAHPRASAPLSATRITAVGAGALGSQLITNLGRQGFGRWAVIDDDILMPHNLLRHALGGASIGEYKATQLATFVNSFFENEPACTSLIADILECGDKQQVLESVLKEAEVILDLSASATVARHLATGVKSGARRLSLFVTPSGDDLVLLAEDKERTTPLDSVEMQYYRGLAADPELADHLGGENLQHRYGASCRDMSSWMSQDDVALHAAIASRATQRTLQQPEAQIAVWRRNQRGEVRRIDVPTAQAVTFRLDEWTLQTDRSLLERLSTLRQAKLPKETGGVLIGSFDLERKICYVVDTVPSPPDSKEWPTLYIRGCKGLAKQVEAISKKTAGQLDYIGEWHSHPANYSTKPSDDDLLVFSWITEHLSSDGFPAVMMIAGDRGANPFIGQILSVENLLA